MTWKAFHNRGETLRAVIAESAVRRDGILPMDVPGVAERFRDELDLLGALQMRWHTRPRRNGMDIQIERMRSDRRQLRELRLL